MSDTRPHHGALSEPWVDSLLVLVFMLCAAFVRMYGLGLYDYHHDELWHLYISAQPTIEDVFYSNLIEDGHPIVPYLLWHVLAKFSMNAWLFRAPSLIAGILCVPMGYFVGREMFESRRGGVFTAFFMAFSGALIEQSDLVRGYSMAIFFLLVTLWSIYRYRRDYNPLYLLAYVVSTSLALLCEFALLPVTVFTALYLGYVIFRQPERKLLAVTLWTTMHTIWVMYIVGFTYLLHTIGMFHGFINFLYSSNRSLSATVIIYGIYLFKTLMQVNVFYLPTFLALPSAAYAACYACIWVMVGLGTLQLVRQRRWALLLLVVLPVFSMVILRELNITFMFSTRHNMGILFSALILSYETLIYFRGSRWFAVLQKHMVGLSLAACALICIIFVADGDGWRTQETVEFGATYQQSAAFYEALDQNIHANDIVIVNWQGFLHLWQKHPCSPKPVSAYLKYYSCYKAPVYMLNGEWRSASAFWKLPLLQRAVQSHAGAQAIKSADRVWIVEDWLNLYSDIANWKQFLAVQGHGELWQKVESYAQQNIEFRNKEKEAAANRTVIYNYDANCPDGRDNEKAITNGSCFVQYLAYTLPKKFIVESLIKHPPYYDLLAHLNNTQQ